MRRRNRMGYRGYQGRGGGSSGWLKALVVVLAVMVVAGGGYLLAQSVGVSVPGWLPQQADTTQPPEQAQTSQPQPEDSPSPTPSAQPSTPPTVEDIRAVEVSMAQVLDGSAQRLLEQADCDALMVEVKGEWGTLQWPSQVSQAQTWGAVSGQESLAQALQALSDQDIYLVARMDCFRDQLLCDENVDSALLMTQGGNRWYDNMGMSWISPLSHTARDYLVQLCVELTRMGFDELVLDSAYFPDQGEVHILAQSDNYPQTRSAPVETFWKQVSEAVQDSGVVLSAQVRGDSLLDGGATTGMTPQLLDQYAQRVWVTLEGVDSTQVETILTQAGVDAGRQMMGHTAQSGQSIWTCG